MDWDKLRIFHAVAEAGSFTGAGKNINLSQSAVSRHISTLEQSLGVSLFRRHTRGLVLTEQGDILHDATKGIFNKLSIIQGQLTDTRHLPEGPLTITVSDFIGSTWLAPKLAEFKARYPQIQLSVIFDDRILNLNMRQADAAVRLSKAKEPNLIQKHLTGINFHICGSRDYLHRYGRPEKIADLKNHTLIAYPEGMKAPFPEPSWLFQTARISMRDNRLLMMNSMFAIYRAVCDGAGLAVLPDYLIHENPDLEMVIPNLQRPVVDMYFIYAEERRQSKRISAFRDFLTENIRKTAFNTGPHK